MKRIDILVLTESTVTGLEYMLMSEPFNFEKIDHVEEGVYASVLVHPDVNKYLLSKKWNKSNSFEYDWVEMFLSDTLNTEEPRVIEGLEHIKQTLKGEYFDGILIEHPVIGRNFIFAQRLLSQLNETNIRYYVFLGPKGKYRLLCENNPQVGYFKSHLRLTDFSLKHMLPLITSIS